MPAPDARIAVTGVGGYLGGRVLSALGDRAFGIARGPVPWLPDDRLVRADLLGPVDELRRCFAGCTAVVHLAGHNEVFTAAQPETAVVETIRMAERVAEAAADAGVGRLVYASTVHVYGASLEPGSVVDEETAARPTSDYARARLTAEEILAGAHELDVVVLRLTNAVGAAVHPSVDRWTLVANDLCRQAVFHKELVLQTPGLQWRDFIVLADACRAVDAASEPATVRAGVYNLGSGIPTQIRRLAELVQDRVEVHVGWRPILVAPTATEPADEPYVVSVERLAEAGLRGRADLAEGIDEIVDQCVRHEHILRDA